MRGATRRTLLLRGLERHFNPRAPCGARRNEARASVSASKFQSTRPMRGATRKAAFIQCNFLFQSTRPMRGATMHTWKSLFHSRISIHAPHAGRDKYACLIILSNLHFNPRAPCGARRIPRHVRHQERQISIHAPHAGRDPTSLVEIHWFRHFNPRAPCGARRIIPSP